MSDEPRLPWPDPTPFLAAALAHRSMPERIGRYQILDELGAGGMGVVYRATQETPRREVALKVLHPGRHGARGRRRFEREVELLGRLEHRGIARLYEADEDLVGGARTPFIAMELVDGDPIHRFARDRSLELSDRLRLLVAVCDAVEYAHERGVVHRDLKPGNILVTPDGEPKVLDFGIARALESDETDSPPTETGQILGTVAYMSPEQLDGDPRLIDAQSDVYALGVIAYELVTGRLPLDVRHHPLVEAARVIRDQDPLPASSITGEADADIDAILATALAKDRRHRYRSAAALGADLTRWLDDQPILARPPTAWGTAMRLARRHRAATTAAVAIGVTLIGAAAISIDFALRARSSERTEREQRQRAELETRRSQAVNDFLVDLINTADPFVPGAASGSDVTIGAALDQAVKRLDGAFPDAPDAEAAVRSAIANGYSGMGRYDDALTQIALARHRLAGDEESASVIRHDLRLRRDEAVARGWLGEHDAAIRTMTAVLDEQRARYGAQSHEVLATLLNLGWLMHRARRYEEARPILGESYDLAQKITEPHEPVRFRVATARAAQLRTDGDLDGAATMLRDALRLGELRYPDGHPTLGILRNNLARVSHDLGDLDAALEGYREAAEMLRRCGRHPTAADVLNNLGMALLDQGDLEGAERALRESIDVYRSVDPDDNRDSIGSIANLAIVLFEARKYAESEEAYRRTADYFASRHGPDHWRVLCAKVGIGECAWRQGREAEAEATLLDAHRRLIETKGRSFHVVPAVARRIVEFYEGTGRPELADPFRPAGPSD